MAEPYIGEIRRFAGSYTPDGWLFCDGRLLRIAEYTELFAVIGTRFGSGDGAFALPNLNEPTHPTGDVAYIIATAGRMPRQPERTHAEHV